MKFSSLTLEEAIRLVDEFLYVKITFNDRVIYDDYDNDEYRSPYSVIPERIEHYRNSIVESVEIYMVEHHHSIIRMYGKLVEE
jgi:hypothetical protein